jgi:hypothetical protein
MTPPGEASTVGISTVGISTVGISTVGISTVGISTVRCASCHRVERWQGDLREVRSVGGARRALDPERRALKTVLAAIQGETGPVVAACPACGQPMLASDRGLTPIGWSFVLPEDAGTVRIEPDGTALGPDGPTSLSAASAAVRAAWRAAPDPIDELRTGLTLVFQVMVLLLMLAPIAVWLFSVLFVSVFLSHVGDVL